MLTRVHRWIPYMILAAGLLAILQLATTLVSFLRAHSAWLVHHGKVLVLILAALAAVSWLFVLLGMLRRRNCLPAFLTRWRGLMDILDRLSNRAELEKRLAQEVESI